VPEIHTGETVASADKRQTAELSQNGRTIPQESRADKPAFWDRSGSSTRAPELEEPTNPRFVANVDNKDGALMGYTGADNRTTVPAAAMAAASSASTPSTPAEIARAITTSSLGAARSLIASTVLRCARSQRSSPSVHRTRFPHGSGARGDGRESRQLLVPVGE
jgi:hypothetical protein